MTVIVHGICICKYNEFAFCSSIWSQITVQILAGRGGETPFKYHLAVYPSFAPLYSFFTMDRTWTRRLFSKPNVCTVLAVLAAGRHFPPGFIQMHGETGGGV